MLFTTATPLVRDAQARGYAVPAFNTNGGSYDIARAALEAAEELRSPLILQVYEPNTAYRGFGYFVRLAGWLCDELAVSVPVALQLDHGHSHESTVQAMTAGLTSVMIDASDAPLAENMATTARVLETASSRGVSVEAEVGYVKGNEPASEPQPGRVTIPDTPKVAPGRTSVDEAVRFIDAVAVDMLAVAIGTTHGVYRTQSEIDFALLAALTARISTPLVMHGTSGISPADLARLATHGMAKINFGEPFRYSFIRHFNELTDGMVHLWHPWKIMCEVKNRLQAEMQALIIAVGADGKAE